MSISSGGQRREGKGLYIINSVRTGATTLLLIIIYSELETWWNAEYCRINIFWVRNKESSSA